MPPTTWKKFELRICRKFGGERRGADYGDRRMGKNDCKCRRYSLEIKNWKRPSFQVMLDDVRKAEDRREHPSDIPIAVMKRLGDPDDDALVCFRLETFLAIMKPILDEQMILKELGYD